MITKLPFIEPYLKEYDDDDEIKELLENNKCNTIAYKDITNIEELDEYDFIFIVGDDELKKLMINDEILYENYKNKLFFVGNYNDEYNTTLNKMKVGLNIDVANTYTKKIELTNLTQNVSINEMYNIKNNCEGECIDKNLNIFKYLPSSVRQLDVCFVNDKLSIVNLPTV